MFEPATDPGSDAVLATLNATRAADGFALYDVDGRLVDGLSLDEKIVAARENGDFAASISLQQQRAAENRGETDYREIELLKEQHRAALTEAAKAGDGQAMLRLNEQHVIDLANATLDGPNGGRVNIEGPAAVLDLIEREEAARPVDTPWSEERKAQHARQEKARAQRLAGQG